MDRMSSQIMPKQEGKEKQVVWFEPQRVYMTVVR